MPSIIGLGRDQAEATLRANGLSLGSVSRSASSSPEGTVISQSPELGKTAIKGSFVSVVLSRGPEASAPETQTPPVENNETENNNGAGNNNSNGNGGANNNNNNNNPSGGGTSSEENGTSGTASARTFTVKIPETANDTVDVEIIVNGRTIHSATHSKEEGSVSVQIMPTGSDTTASVQAYIDGSKVSDRTINFN